MLNYASHIEEAMASLQGTLRGHLQIACSTSAGKYILPHLIARFRELNPDVRVTVSVCAPDAAIERVCDGRSQLGILSSEAGCREVEYRRFFIDRVVLIAPRAHPWATRESVLPEDLVDEPFILGAEIAGTRRVMQAGLLEHSIRIHDLDVVMELGNAEAIESAVEAGIGIAFVSRLVAQRGIAAGYVAEIPVDGLCLERELFMIRNSRRAQTRVQAAFWEHSHADDNLVLLRAAQQEKTGVALAGR
jgi:DNA-binding transcriptional LysR family regulator